MDEEEEEEREERVNFEPGSAVPYVATPKSCFAFDSVSHLGRVKTFGPKNFFYRTFSDPRLCGLPSAPLQNKNRYLNATLIK